MFLNPLRTTIFTFAIFTLLSMNLSAQVAFTLGSEYQYLKGVDAADLAANWYEPDFDDSDWPSSIAPFRYGDGTGGTELADMQGSYSTLYLRSAFTVQQLEMLSRITMGVNFDDGFIIWINGEKALSQLAPENNTYNSLANGNHESGLVETFFFDVTDLDLVEGENSLAVQVFNVTLAESSDFYFDMSINAQAEMPELVDSIGLTFSHASGFYEAPFNLSISTSMEGADIVYTLDGSNPQNSISSIQASSPVSVLIDPDSNTNRSLTPAVVVRASVSKDGNKSSDPSARTFIYMDRVLTQTHPGGNWPDENTSNNNYQYIDYAMDPEVVNNGQYAAIMDDALLDLPSISVVTDNANLFDASYGIYMNAMEQGYDWERECSVELINPDKSEGFNVNAGLRIRGGWSRHNDFPKHALRLFFREEYGDSKLSYPLFEDEGVSEFDKIDLRCAQNYSWANNSNSGYNTFVREVFTRDSQKASGQPYTRSRYYHLYLNGLYWGIFQTQERSEARFASDYFGDSKDDYDVIKITGVENKDIAATDGTLDKWEEIYNFTVQGFSSNENYFRMEGKDASGERIPGAEVYVDIDNLIDYMINIIYSGNYDSPVSAWGGNKSPNNMYAITNREKKTFGFKFFIHDGEHTLMNDATSGPGIGLYENRANIGDRTGYDRMEVTSFSRFHSQWLHYKLSKNEEYRIRFASRAWEQLTGNGIFTLEKCTERFNSRAAQIETAIVAESARWGDTRTSSPYTRNEHWYAQLDQVRNDYFPVRTDIVIDQLKDLDLFPSVEAPLFKDAGENIDDPLHYITSPLSITIDNPSSTGVIYYTLDGSDPREVGGGFSESALSISSGGSLGINASAVLKARVLKGDSWSAETAVSFIAEQADYTDLKVTEVHYHPLDSIHGTDTISGKEFEFIEFRNVSTSDGINLSGLVIDSAIYYEFPVDAVLLPEQYYVVAAKPAKFFDRYGVEASGNYSSSLSNGGEQVILRKTTGEIIMDFTYDDEVPWPLEADGEGPSLMSVDSNPEGDPNYNFYWTASAEVHGTPFYHQLISGVEESLAVFDPNSIQLYPNPTSDLIMVQLSGDMETMASLTIYDLRGTIHYKEHFNSYTEISLDGLNISHGVYLVEITGPEGKAIKKVIYTP